MKKYVSRATMWLGIIALLCGVALLVGIIFIIGGPIFAAANVLEAILDCILPEGWGDDNGPWQH